LRPFRDDFENWTPAECNVAEAPLIREYLMVSAS
jgi:hypothetical protein